MRDHPSSESVLDRLKRIRAVYPTWARELRPWSHQRAPAQTRSVQRTWASDADDHWRALVAVVGHELPAARKNPPTRKKKERPVVEVEPALVEPEWPLFPFVRGKTAVIVGGAPKEPNRDRWRRTFGSRRSTGPTSTARARSRRRAADREGRVRRRDRDPGGDLSSGGRARPRCREGRAGCRGRWSTATASRPSGRGLRGS